MAGWRFFASRLNGDGTETILDFEIPLTGAEIITDLSGPGGITGSITPEFQRLKDESGNPILQQWNTAIYAELDGVIRGGGIIINPIESGQTLAIDAMGFSGYPSGQCHVGNYSEIGLDPLDGARHIWEHLQAQPAGNLGLILDGTISPVRIGIPEDPKLTRARNAERQARETYEDAKAARITLDKRVKDAEADAVDAMKAVYHEARLEWFPQGKIIQQASAPSGSNASVYNIWVDTDTQIVATYSNKWNLKNATDSAAVRRRIATWEKVKDGITAADKDRDAAKVIETKMKDAWDTAKATLRDEAGGAAQPYVLAAWMNQDLGQEFDKLAEETPFEYVTAHTWERDGTILHRLRLGYPRIGRRRPDLRFMVGENVTEMPPVEYASDEYASEVLLLGAGEGRAMVRARAYGRPTGKLRRVQAVERKEVRDVEAAKRLGAIEVRYRSGEPDIGEEIRIRDHPNARLGSYDVGDEILVQVPTGWSSGRDIWVRILAITIRPEDGLTSLSVTRSEKVD